MLVENRQFEPTHVCLAPPWGRHCKNFVQTFGIKKLDFLGYRMSLFAWSYVKPFWYNAGLCQTDGQTDTRR